MSDALTIQPIQHSVPRMVCTFRVANLLYGVDIADVKEVNRETTFTPIPHTPRVVRGYVNLRGQIFLVLDIRLMLGFDPITIDGDTRLLLFKPTVGENLGILVDRIGDIATLPAADIEENHGPSEDSVGSDLVTGVGKLAEGLVLLLDPCKIPDKIETKLNRQSPGAD